VNVREMTASDRRFVAPTWALSSRYEGMSKAARFRLVDRVLDGGARCIVLAEGATVHAWACGAEDALHYAYVPPELRGHGIAAKLIALVLGSYAERINVTHPWPRASSRVRYTPHFIHRAEAA
jgi:GNAT superfamily N-acetyltransferase